MDCGDAGQHLLSRHLAEDLEQYAHWQPLLRDLGECDVKHGMRLHLVNLSDGELGNPTVPQKLRAIADHARTGRSWRLIAAAAVAVAILSGAVFLAKAKRTQTSPSIFAISNLGPKSIAVLPFANLSGDPDNAFFTDGVQDEILTGLSRVADLKVISRTSVMQYKAGPRRNLRELATDLGVAHVLEGTVQRAGGRVRVNAQLIDARTDSQLWAERYDRDVADVFAIESELAGKIVAQLQAKISPNEKAAIEEKPTADLTAHDLYIRAKTLIATAVFSTPQAESLSEAVRLLKEAIERDPAFALAYYQLAHTHDLLYFTGIDHTPARLALADAAIQSLTRLLPNSGEAHLALAKHSSTGVISITTALGTNLVWHRRACLTNRGRLCWPAISIAGKDAGDQSIKNLERAVELDPQNPAVLQQLALTYDFLRRYADEKRVYDRAIAVTPKDVCATSFTRRGRTQLACRSASADLDNRGVCRPRFRRSQTSSVGLAARMPVYSRFQWCASRHECAADRWVLRRHYSGSAILV